MKTKNLNKDILTNLRHINGIPRNIREARNGLEGISQAVALAADEIESLEKAIKDASKIFDDIICDKKGAIDSAKTWLSFYHRKRAARFNDQE